MVFFQAHSSPAPCWHHSTAGFRDCHSWVCLSLSTGYEKSKAAVVKDLNTGHGITNSTAQAQGASSLKGCKISCMASLKEVCPQEPQEEDTCCNDTLRSAEGCTQASPPPSYRAISRISSICNFPNGPKTWPSLKTYQTQEKAASWLLVWQADARKHPGPMSWGGRRAVFWCDTIPFPAY